MDSAVEAPRSPSVPFQTSDFYLACFMHARGYAIVDVQRSLANKRVTFHFDQLNGVDTSEAKDLVLGFYNGTEHVSAFKFCSALRELRGLLYNAGEPV